MAASVTFTLNGTELIADVSGGLYWPEQQSFVLADLHLEKGSSFARSGLLLPPYDSRASLDALGHALARHRPRRVICLGDSFHDGDGAIRLGSAERERLSELTRTHEWIWVAGNHDPAPPNGIGGMVVGDEITFGPLTFRHCAEPESAAGEVSGHYHPKASLWVRARRLSGRCFVADRRRIVLPAFGAYAGGLDVRDPALASLFPKGCAVHLIARGRVATIASDISTSID